MKKLLLTLLLNINLFAQLSSPTPEAVYGGRINAIASIPLNSTQTRVFISTESANSVFYADMTTADASVAPSFGTFTVMPSVGDDGYGKSIQKMSVHKKSSSLFFITQTGDLVVTDSFVSTVTTANDIGLSIYRAEWDGSSWTVRQNMDSAYSESGSTITASINDLAVSATGDMVYAAGVDEISKMAKVYYKIL